MVKEKTKKEMIRGYIIMIIVLVTIILSTVVLVTSMKKDNSQTIESDWEETNTTLSNESLIQSEYNEQENTNKSLELANNDTKNVFINSSSDNPFINGAFYEDGNVSMKSTIE